ncbi:hypothetical protein GCM10027586_03830 [Kineococcus gypseus]|uniref:helix-turn-helix domain-containing protein n=1 Tax=Kineococcus gypseus TaxID=1637102 RepID=UPI003D7CB0A0
MPTPWTPQDDEQVQRLYASGASLRGIATAMGRSLSTVQRAANRLSLTFDRAQTRAATAAKTADNRARRAELEQLLLENALHLAQRVRQPMAYVDHGGADFHRVDWELDEPTPADQAKLMQAAGAGVERAMKIAEFDGNGGEAEGKSLITGLVDALRERVQP